MRFAEVLWVTNTVPNYIDDRLMQHVILKQTFPAVPTVSWFYAKGFVDRVARSGSIREAYDALRTKRASLQFVDMETGRTKRRRGAAAGVGAWYDEEGNQLRTDENGRVRPRLSPE